MARDRIRALGTRLLADSADSGPIVARTMLLAAASSVICNVRAAALAAGAAIGAGGAGGKQALVRPRPA